jgi:hypothetical protein
MDPMATQKVVDAAATIVQNANNQGWAIGMVALACIVMFTAMILMGRWLMRREERVSREAIEREQNLRSSIIRLDDFGRTTLVDLITRSTTAMNNVAAATATCLSFQSQRHLDADRAHDDLAEKHTDADRAHDDAERTHRAK